VPACAMLWARGGLIRWLALLLTTLGIWFTSDIPLTLHIMLTGNQSLSPVTWQEKILMILVIRPVPLMLLLLSIFYLWVYVLYVRKSVGVPAPDVALA
jgi:hypothetical protein